MATCGICGDGDETVGIDFYDEDGMVFAHAHFEPDQALVFLGEFAASLNELRNRKGIKPS